MTDTKPRSPLAGRPAGSQLSTGVLSTIQSGAMRTVYRGVPFLKSPFDIGLYLQLLWRLQPATVIEIGSKHGGSALWFADMMSSQGAAGRVVSVDIDPIAKIVDPRITFLQGDASQLWAALPEALLASCARPWLVVEDASHLYEDSLAVLRFFDTRLKSGDYIVIEDGVVSQFAEAQYARYEDGPCRALTDFLAERGEAYVLDTTLCDHYGPNMTYNPNGWLRRV